MYFGLKTIAWQSECYMYFGLKTISVTMLIWRYNIICVDICCNMQWIELLYVL